jgi:hypothetical protein
MVIKGLGSTLSTQMIWLVEGIRVEKGEREEEEEEEEEEGGQSKVKL